MGNLKTVLKTLEEIAAEGRSRSIIHQFTENEELKGVEVDLNGRQMLNFGSCSYLGLEYDSRLKEASKEAIDKFGTQFSSSRAYISLGQYKELESLLHQMFGFPALVTPTTTLGHISAIPVLIEDDDAVILDHQVHNSIQMAASMVKARGVHVELLRHNQLDRLEERIKFLSQKKKRIWYMADGIYSMYGDKSPVLEVQKLMDKYPSLHYYVDDAHGMSCYGKHGVGYVRNQAPLHARQILAVSLNKAFASGGGALIFPSEEWKFKVRSFGGPMITSGPLQPANLGAAIAAAKIHLSDEVDEMKDELHENIKYTMMMLEKYHLPVVSDTNSTIFFVMASYPKLAYNVLQRMMDRGFFLNLGIFPAVPIKNTGIRFTITRLHEFEQIEEMVAALAEEYSAALIEEDIELEKIYRAFKKDLPEESKLLNQAHDIIGQSDMEVDHHHSIDTIDNQEWDKMLGDRGSFDAEGLSFLEKTFVNHPQEENRWAFDYLLIRDKKSDEVVCATVMTSVLSKDDMMSPADISEMVEMKRKTEPLYLVSKTLTMGTLLTEGDHLYVDKTNPGWKGALKLLLEQISNLHEERKTASIALRDFAGDDVEVNDIIMKSGFFKTELSESNSIENLDWNGREQFVAGLKKKYRQEFRKNILANESNFDLISNPQFDDLDIKKWYKLYLKVKSRNLGLNTFDLPFNLFEEMAHHPNWDILALYSKEKEGNDENQKLVGITFSYIGEKSYNPMIIGLDYNFLDQKIYQQLVFACVSRGGELAKQYINLGFSASLEKRKLGASTKTKYAYMQVRDHFNADVISSLNPNHREKQLI